MRNHIPATPLSTRFSGSARETEFRIRNIVQGPKKRPPIPLMVLTALLILLCGNLVSCQPVSSDIPSKSDGTQSASLQGADDQAILDLLFQEALSSSAVSVFDTSSPLGKELLTSIPGENCTLAAAHFYDSYPRCSLVIGTMDAQRPHLEGALFLTSTSGGIPHVVTFQQDEADYLLYTVTGGTQGFTGGEAGLIRFDGNDFTWVWPVEGDIRDETSQARADYLAYWEGRKPLLYSGGVEVFAETPNYFPQAGSAVVQWTLESIQSFYTPEGGEIPSSSLWAVREWLEVFTRDHDNPWDALNTSALWRICSLTKDTFQYPNQQESEQAYQLVARADGNDQLYFAANILINEESGTLSACYNYATGTLEEVTDQVINLQSRWEFTDGSPQLPQSNMQPWPGGLLDSEVCLYLDNNPSPVGPGSALTPSYLSTMDFYEEEIIDDWATYNSGDYWTMRSGTSDSGDFSATGYYYTAESVEAIYSLETDSTDMHTPRGIRVGSSRQEVEDAYPEAHTLDTYTSMWYWPSGEDQGPAIQFLFNLPGDTVTCIRLYNDYDSLS